MPRFGHANRVFLDGSVGPSVNRAPTSMEAAGGIVVLGNPPTAGARREQKRAYAVPPYPTAPAGSSLVQAQRPEVMTGRSMLLLCLSRPISPAISMRPYPSMGRTKPRGSHPFGNEGQSGGVTINR